jgi:hypothetical protein
MWALVVGSPPASASSSNIGSGKDTSDMTVEEEMEKAAYCANLGERLYSELLCYEEVESLLLCALINRGTVVLLNEK